MQVVSAPTGSGKTVVLELTILRMLAAHVLDSGRWNLVPGRHKAIYVAPTRALCQEKVRDWTARLAYLHLVVLECTGDCTQQDIADLASADIIATTPYAASVLWQPQTHMLRLMAGMACMACITRMACMACMACMQAAITPTCSAGLPIPAAVYLMDVAATKTGTLPLQA